MAGNFKEFIIFINEVTGQCPTTISKYFQDVFIYVPRNKIPPQSLPPGTCTESDRTLGLQHLQTFFSSRNEFSKLLNNQGWELLVDHLGIELLRFCLQDCVFAKRTRTGAYMVSCLTELHGKIRSFPYNELHGLFFVSFNCSKEHTSDIQKSTKPNNDNVQKTSNDPEHLFNAKHLEICTDNMILRISQTSKFPDDHILANKNSEVSISSQVIETKVEKVSPVGCKEHVTALEPILKRLRKLNMKYNYESELAKLMAVEMESDIIVRRWPAICQELPLVLLKQYFTNICCRIIPPGLLGSHKNRNILVKSICNLLETPNRQSINLMPYILKLKISDLEWLDEKINSDTRLIIAGKLFKWLYEKLILEIFRTQFYIIVTTGTRKVYIRRIDWINSMKGCVLEMCRQKIIGKIDGMYTTEYYDGRWIFFPKKRGIRPITSSIKTSKQQAAKALCFLQQLYCKKYGPTGKVVFFHKWNDLVDRFRNNNKSIYLVRCDIESAYGSIDQRKLVAIVESLAESIESTLFLTHYEISRNLNAVKNGHARVKQYFLPPELEMPLAPGAIFASCPRGVQTISKKTLLEEIKSRILKQVVRIKNQHYLLQKGIAQGAILSPILCDIYYANMEETELAQFKNEGSLYRYVDDIIYATENQASAERFLEIVKQGLPNYSCRFNITKTMTNLPGHRHVYTPLAFLGYNINPRTLEVTPDYSTNIRYVTALSKISGQKSFTVFRKRLTNFASLKLDALILNAKINSSETIIHNIKCTFERQAERCLWLVRALIDDIPSRRIDIFNQIRTTNIRIIRRVQRHFRANGYDFEALVPELVMVPWKSYRKVFGKAQTIHVHFRSLFLGCIASINRSNIKPKRTPLCVEIQD
ncbi:telomerase reverse transcriptase-like [Athalia rosae]|uniref:telomerase reverse transcriptase-like n=1 Tax=Athalia rosae TaxID=37344 RepID=UPI002033CABD|nr:telomerase reverse transcriptase-like [Athalia rosae]